MAALGDFISFEDLAAALRAFFRAEGVPAEVADVLARNCAMCERDGSHSHGVFRVPGYRASLRSGAIDAAAEPELDRVARGILRIDARGGYAQPALARAMPTIREMVAAAGTATVAIRNSHHFSALWPDLEPFAEAGLVALTVVAGGPTVTVRGADRNVFGTNPIAFGFPLAGARPVVIDLATSTMSNGDLRITRDEGRKVPPGTGLGEGGRDTDDPDEILTHGGALPFGRAQGRGAVADGRGPRVRPDRRGLFARDGLRRPSGQPDAEDRPVPPRPRPGPRRQRRILRADGELRRLPSRGRRRPPALRPPLPPPRRSGPAGHSGVIRAPAD